MVEMVKGLLKLLFHHNFTVYLVLSCIVLRYTEQRIKFPQKGVTVGLVCITPKHQIGEIN